ncbi:hypothetical protein Tco_0252031 [Tanacetum coccineum]
MCTYLKNMEGWKPKSLKNKSFVNIQELFDKAMKRVNTFVDYRTELVEESSKKAKTEHEESSKKSEAEIAQKNNDRDDITIDATPLSTKSQTIVDYKIYKEGKKSYFQIIRADGKTQMYLTFGKMLKNFDREDLEVIWSIVKERFKKTDPVNYMDNFLLLNLKTMFEHHVEDNNMLFYLLVEKMYPLTNHTLHQMFNDVKLQVDYECEMAFELLRLVKKQLKEGYGRIVGIKSLLEVTAAKVCVTTAKQNSLLSRSLPKESERYLLSLDIKDLTNLELKRSYGFHNWYQSLVARDLGSYKVIGVVFMKRRSKVATSMGFKPGMNRLKEAAVFEDVYAITKEQQETQGSATTVKDQVFMFQFLLLGFCARSCYVSKINLYMEAWSLKCNFRAQEAVRVYWQEMITSQLQGKLWIYDEVRVSSLSRRLEVVCSPKDLRSLLDCNRSRIDHLELGLDGNVCSEIFKSFLVLDALDVSDWYFALDVVDRHFYWEKLEYEYEAMRLASLDLRWLHLKLPACIGLSNKYRYGRMSCAFLDVCLSKDDMSKDANKAFQYSITASKSGFPFEIG